VKSVKIERFLRLLKAVKVMFRLEPSETVKPFFFVAVAVIAVVVAVG
jgi:hypothetical protein